MAEDKRRCKNEPAGNGDIINMKKNITMFSCAVALLFLAFTLLTCSAAIAGPMANTQEFQQKAVKSAARGIPGVSSEQKPVVEQAAEEALVEGQPAEEEKIKIEVSEKEIDTRVPSLSNNLKDIIRDAEANIKRVDDQLKAEDDERGAKERYDKGTAMYNEGKFEEAGKEWNAALGMAKELEFRKRIRGSLKRAARQIREAKEKREAEEWAKKKAQLRGQPEVASKKENLKK
jgi:hypothetical protein